MDADQSLLERWRAGEQAAGRDLLARYFEQLHRFFSNKCREPDELVQATFLALVGARNQFAGRSSFRTYLFTIARHTLHAHLRVVQRERAFDPEVSSIAQLVTTPGSRLARGEDLRRLCAALRALPLDQQTLLELHLHPGVRHRELERIGDRRLRQRTRRRGRGGLAGLGLGERRRYQRIRHERGSSLPHRSS